MKAKSKVSGETVAIKFVNELGDCEYDWIKVIREIQIMDQLGRMPQNKFTVKLLDLVLVPPDENNQMGVFIVMEYMDLDIKKLLNKAKEVNLTEEVALILIYILMCAIRFLHSANVMHRDIKPANILVDNDLNVKICDFGLSRSLPDSLIGKGSGNSKRIRDSIMQDNLIELGGIDACQKAIANKLN